MTTDQPAKWNAAGLSFGREPSASDREWWHSVFQDRMPLDVARKLVRGMPGQPTFSFQIYGLDESFVLDIEGRDGNSTIWFHSSALQLQDAVFYQDGLNITHSLQGMGYAQRLMGNVADFANEVGVKRLTLDAENIGGFVWARAGAVPQGSWTELRQHIDGKTQRLLHIRKEITVEEAAIVERLSRLGQTNPQAIWAISALRTQVTSSHRREPNDPIKITLGQELLIGSRWKGEINFDHPLSRLMFRRWRRTWRQKKRSRPQKRSIPSRLEGPSP